MDSGSGAQTPSDGLLPVPPQFSVSTVIVTNISPLATEQNLRDFFKNCGNVVQISLMGDGLGLSQYAFVRFENMAQANAACTLDTGAIMGLPVKIVMAASDIPIGSPLSPAAAPTPLLAPGLLGVTPAPPPVVLMSSPTTAISYQEKQDEIARTIYVGNVNSTITTEQLMQFFALCGPITFCRLAGDESHPSRFAFIEFATKEAAQAAMLLNGSMLVDRPIKVNHSKNPIVKPPKTVDNPRDEQILDAVKRAAARLAKKVSGTTADESREGRHSRSRSRSRSRERRRRHSGRGRSRSRSRSRDRYRSRRSRRSRSRSRSRSRERDRRRSREREHQRHRDRDRDRDRGRDRRRSSERDRSRRSRDRSPTKREESPNGSESSSSTSRKRARPEDENADTSTYKAEITQHTPEKKQKPSSAAEADGTQIALDLNEH